METRIKERLVGAIALVALVVVVVPELLTGPKAPAPAPLPAPAGAVGGAVPIQRLSIDLDPAERGKIRRPSVEPAEADTGAGTAAAPAAAVPATPAGAALATLPTPAASRAPPAEVVPDAKPLVPGAAASAPPAASGAAALSPPPAAAAAASPHPASPAATAPVPAAAPAASVPRPTPATGSAEGWVVQLGSFSRRENAEGLAKSLRGKGYRAFVSEFRGSGKVLYRVRVGPEQDRGRADQVAARLAHDGHKGSVVPQP